MLDIFAFLYFIIVALKVLYIVCSEGDVFREFRAPRSLAFACLLLPIGPIFPLFSSRLHVGGWEALLLSALCYIPAVVMGTVADRAFDRAGTSRVERAKSAADAAFLAGAIGCGYIVVLTAFRLVVYSFNAGEGA